METTAEHTSPSSSPPPCSSHPPPICRCLPTPIGGLSSLLGSFPSPSFPASSHHSREDSSSALPSRNLLFLPPSSPTFSNTPHVDRPFSTRRKTEGHDETAEKAFPLTDQRDLSQRGSASLRARKAWEEKHSLSSRRDTSHPEELSQSLGDQGDKKDFLSCLMKERNTLKGGCCVEGGGVWLVRGIDLLELGIHLTCFIRASYLEIYNTSPSSSSSFSSSSSDSLSLSLLLRLPLPASVLSSRLFDIHVEIPSRKSTSHSHERNRSSSSSSRCPTCDSFSLSEEDEEREDLCSSSSDSPSTRKTPWVSSSPSSSSFSPQRRKTRAYRRDEEARQSNTTWRGFLTSLSSSFCKKRRRRRSPWRIQGQHPLGERRRRGPLLFSPSSSPLLATRRRGWMYSQEGIQGGKKWRKNEEERRERKRRIRASIAVCFVTADEYIHRVEFVLRANSGRTERTQARDICIRKSRDMHAPPLFFDAREGQDEEDGQEEEEGERKRDLTDDTCFHRMEEEEEGGGGSYGDREEEEESSSRRLGEKRQVVSSSLLLHPFSLQLKSFFSSSLFSPETFRRSEPPSPHVFFVSKERKEEEEETGNENLLENDGVELTEGTTPPPPSLLLRQEGQGKEETATPVRPFSRGLSTTSQLVLIDQNLAILSEGVGSPLPCLQESSWESKSLLLQLHTSLRDDEDEEIQGDKKENEKKKKMKHDGDPRGRRDTCSSSSLCPGSYPLMKNEGKRREEVEKESFLHMKVSEEEERMRKVLCRDMNKKMKGEEEEEKDTTSGSREGYSTGRKRRRGPDVVHPEAHVDLSGSGKKSEERSSFFFFPFFKRRRVVFPENWENGKSFLSSSSSWHTYDEWSQVDKEVGQQDDRKDQKRCVCTGCTYTSRECYVKRRTMKISYAPLSCSPFSRLKRKVSRGSLDDNGKGDVKQLSQTSSSLLSTRSREDRGKDEAGEEEKKTEIEREGRLHEEEEEEEKEYRRRWRDVSYIAKLPLSSAFQKCIKRLQQKLMKQEGEGKGREVKGGEEDEESVFVLKGGDEEEGSIRHPCHVSVPRRYREDNRSTSLLLITCGTSSPSSSSFSSSLCKNREGEESHEGEGSSTHLEKSVIGRQTSSSSSSSFHSCFLIPPAEKKTKKNETVDESSSSSETTSSLYPPWGKERRRDHFSESGPEVCIWYVEILEKDTRGGTRRRRSLNSRTTPSSSSFVSCSFSLLSDYLLNLAQLDVHNTSDLSLSSDLLTSSSSFLSFSSSSLSVCSSLSSSSFFSSSSFSSQALGTSSKDISPPPYLSAHSSLSLPPRNPNHLSTKTATSCSFYNSPSSSFLKQDVLSSSSSSSIPLSKVVSCCGLYVSSACEEETVSLSISERRMKSDGTGEDQPVRETLSIASPLWIGIRDNRGRFYLLRGKVICEDFGEISHKEKEEEDDERRSLKAVGDEEEDRRKKTSTLRSSLSLKGWPGKASYRRFFLQRRELLDMRENDGMEKEEEEEREEENEEDEEDLPHESRDGLHQDRRRGRFMKYLHGDITCLGCLDCSSCIHSQSSSNHLSLLHPSSSLSFTPSASSGVVGEDLSPWTETRRRGRPHVYKPVREKEGEEGDRREDGENAEEKEGASDRCRYPQEREELCKTNDRRRRFSARSLSESMKQQTYEELASRWLLTDTHLWLVVSTSSTFSPSSSSSLFFLDDALHSPPTDESKENLTIYCFPLPSSSSSSSSSPFLSPSTSPFSTTTTLTTHDEENRPFIEKSENTKNEISHLSSSSDLSAVRIQMPLHISPYRHVYERNKPNDLLNLHICLSLLRHLIHSLSTLLTTARSLLSSSSFSSSQTRWSQARSVVSWLASYLDAEGEAHLRPPSPPPVSILQEGDFSKKTSSAPLLPPRHGFSFTEKIFGLEEKREQNATFPEHESKEKKKTFSSLFLLLLNSTEFFEGSHSPQPFQEEEEATMKQKRDGKSYESDQEKAFLSRAYPSAYVLQEECWLERKRENPVEERRSFYVYRTYHDFLWEVIHHTLRQASSCTSLLNTNSERLEKEEGHLFHCPYSPEKGLESSSFSQSSRQKFSSSSSSLLLPLHPSLSLATEGLSSLSHKSHLNTRQRMSADPSSSSSFYSYDMSDPLLATIACCLLVCYRLQSILSSSSFQNMSSSSSSSFLLARNSPKQRATSSLTDTPLQHSQAISSSFSCSSSSLCFFFLGSSRVWARALGLHRQRSTRHIDEEERQQDGLICRENREDKREREKGIRRSAGKTTGRSFLESFLSPPSLSSYSLTLKSSFKYFNEEDLDQVISIPLIFSSSTVFPFFVKTTTPTFSSHSSSSHSSSSFSSSSTFFPVGPVTCSLSLARPPLSVAEVAGCYLSSLTSSLYEESLSKQNLSSLPAVLLSGEDEEEDDGEEEGKEEETFDVVKHLFDSLSHVLHMEVQDPEDVKHRRNLPSCSSSFSPTCHLSSSSSSLSSPPETRRSSSKGLRFLSQWLQDWCEERTRISQLEKRRQRRRRRFSSLCSSSSLYSPVDTPEGLLSTRQTGHYLLPRHPGRSRRDTSSLLLSSSILSSSSSSHFLKRLSFLNNPAWKDYKIEGLRQVRREHEEGRREEEVEVPSLEEKVRHLVRGILQRHIQSLARCSSSPLWRLTLAGCILLEHIHRSRRETQTVSSSPLSKKISRRGGRSLPEYRGGVGRRPSHRSDVSQDLTDIKRDEDGSLSLGDPELIRLIFGDRVFLSLREKRRERKKGEDLAGAVRKTIERKEGLFFCQSFSCFHVPKRAEEIEAYVMDYYTSHREQATEGEQENGDKKADEDHEELQFLLLSLLSPLSSSNIVTWEGEKSFLQQAASQKKKNTDAVNNSSSSSSSTSEPSHDMVELVEADQEGETDEEKDEDAKNLLTSFVAFLLPFASAGSSSEGDLIDLLRSVIHPISTLRRNALSQYHRHLSKWHLSTRSSSSSLKEEGGIFPSKSEDHHRIKKKEEEKEEKRGPVYLAEQTQAFSLIPPWRDRRNPSTCGLISNICNDVSLRTMYMQYTVLCYLLAGVHYFLRHIEVSRKERRRRRETAAKNDEREEGKRGDKERERCHSRIFFPHDRFCPHEVERRRKEEEENYFLCSCPFHSNNKIVWKPSSSSSSSLSGSIPSFSPSLPSASPLCNNTSARHRRDLDTSSSPAPRHPAGETGADPRQQSKRDDEDEAKEEQDIEEEEEEKLVFLKSILLSLRRQIDRILPLYSGLLTAFTRSGTASSSSHLSSFSVSHRHSSSPSSSSCSSLALSCTRWSAAPSSFFLTLPISTSARRLKLLHAFFREMHSRSEREGDCFSSSSFSSSWTMTSLDLYMKDSRREEEKRTFPERERDQNEDEISFFDRDDVKEKGEGVSSLVSRLEDERDISSGAPSDSLFSSFFSFYHKTNQKKPWDSLLLSLLKRFALPYRRTSIQEEEKDEDNSNDRSE
ncbi:hypothetical protein CSUI_003855, partial [Cystoisospora suis]